MVRVGVGFFNGTHEQYFRFRPGPTIKLWGKFTQQLYNLAGQGLYGTSFHRS